MQDGLAFCGAGVITAIALAAVAENLAPRRSAATSPHPPAGGGWYAPLASTSTACTGDTING